MSSELHSKRIITVLAHPIQRWQMLIGKWVGLSAFCIVTLALGIALGFGLSRYLGVNIEGNTLAISATRTIAGIVLFGGIATALSATGSAPVAVAITMFVAIVPQLIQPLRDDPSPAYQRIGQALDVTVPPGYDSNYSGVVWAPFPMPRNYKGPVPSIARRPQVDYPEQRKRTAETAAYAGAYVLIGCVLFTRRDLKFN